MKSKYSMSLIASALILTLLASFFMPVMAQVPVIGPQLVVKTIPQDDQVRKTGIMLLGLTPNPGWTKGYSDELNTPKIWSQFKLMVTLNGAPVDWQLGVSTEPSPVVSCIVLQKDKVNPVPTKFGVPTKQFPQENLETQVTDISSYFICKPHWTPLPPTSTGWYESVGVLDVYYTGPYLPTIIADNILIVTVTYPIGTTVVWGTDMQDICILGWSMASNDMFITLPGGVVIWSSTDPLGSTGLLNGKTTDEGFVSCDQAALEQRSNLGLAPAATTSG
jgi:hypothetical protein